MSPLSKWLRRRRHQRTLDEAAGRLTAALESQRWDDAVSAGTAAVEAAVAFHDRNHPATVAPRFALAAAHLGAGDLDAAERETEAALAIAQVSPVGLDPPLPALYEQRLAIAERRGDIATAGRLLASLARAYDRMRAPDAAAQASVLHRQALHLARAGEREAAHPLFGRVLSLIEVNDALDPAEVLYNRASLAPADAGLQARLDDFDRALEYDPPPSLRAPIEHNRATMLEEMGDVEAATLAYQRALKHWPHPAQTRPTLVRLARLHHAEGRFDSAVSLYTRARRVAESALEHDVVARIDTWIGDANSHTYR